jgi:hypothetical protein
MLGLLSTEDPREVRDEVVRFALIDSVSLVKEKDREPRVASDFLRKGLINAPSSSGSKWSTSLYERLNMRAVSLAMAGRGVEAVVVARDSGGDNKNGLLTELLFTACAAPCERGCSWRGVACGV